jgi:hypothetical protein
MLPICFFIYVDVPRGDYQAVNITYNVKEVHLGYANGYSFIEVLYYDNGKIKILDGSNYGLNSITVYSTNKSQSYIVHRLTATENRTPKNIYDLYVNENMSFTGVKSEYSVTSDDGMSTVRKQASIS